MIHLNSSKEAKHILSNLGLHKALFHHESLMDFVFRISLGKIPTGMQGQVEGGFKPWRACTMYMAEIIPCGQTQRSQEHICPNIPIKDGKQGNIAFKLYPGTIYTNIKIRR